MKDYVNYLIRVWNRLNRHLSPDEFNKKMDELSSPVFKEFLAMPVNFSNEQKPCYATPATFMKVVKVLDNLK